MKMRTARSFRSYCSLGSFCSLGRQVETGPLIKKRPLVAGQWIVRVDPPSWRRLHIGPELFEGRDAFGLKGEEAVGVEGLLALIDTHQGMNAPVGQRIEIQQPDRPTLWIDGVYMHDGCSTSEALARHGPQALGINSQQSLHISPVPGLDQRPVPAHQGCWCASFRAHSSLRAAVLLTAATPSDSRTLFSISTAISGFSFRNSRALSLPWPIFSPL